MMCNKCKGTSMKIRKNYSHGKHSRPVTSITCKKCGSNDIQKQEETRGRKWSRRR